MASIDDFKKVEMKIGLILEAEEEEATPGDFIR